MIFVIPLALIIFKICGDGNLGVIYKLVENSTWYAFLGVSFSDYYSDFFTRFSKKAEKAYLFGLSSQYFVFLINFSINQKYYNYQY